MREWPKQHRVLATFVLIAAIGTMAYAYFGLYPKIDEANRLKSTLKEKREKLVNSGWPLDAERLELLLADSRRRLNGAAASKSKDPREAIGMKNKSNIILEQSTSMFDDRIGRFFVSTEDFMYEVARLDYQEEFNQIAQRYRGEGIVFAEEEFGLSEDTPAEHTYQLLLRIWTVDCLLELVLENDLALVKNPSVLATDHLGESAQASKITSLPIRAYTLGGEDLDTYIIEMPVRMTLRGELANLSNFVKALHTEGRFLPLNRFEILAENPLRCRADDDDMISIRRVEATVECSAFFRPSEEAPEKSITTMKLLPAGA